MIRRPHRNTATTTSVSAVRVRRLRAVLLLTAVAVTAAPTAATAEQEPRTTPQRAEYACETGEFCLWPNEDYGGEIVRLDLRNTNPEECRALPDGVEARAFGNRLDRHVTVYQDRRCATEGDFSTFPGPGTFVPQSPYVVRAVKVWN